MYCFNYMYSLLVIHDFVLLRNIFKIYCRCFCLLINLLNDLNSPKAKKNANQATLTCTDNTKWLIGGKPIIQSTYTPHHAKSLIIDCMMCNT